MDVGEMAHYSELESGSGYAAVASQSLTSLPEEASDSRALSWKLKSVMDRVGAFLLLVAVGPAMLVIALLVRLDSPGPVFFRQPRFGAGRSVIVVTKFRTMHTERTDIGGRRQATRDDDRVTRIGRFLRKTCLDELPQIWDVFCGRMSLVGPRPHPLSLEVDGQPIEVLIPNYHRRHQVRPGITGLAQINGNRGPVESIAMGRERLRYDVEYIEGHSIWLDVRILLRTLAVPFEKDGSY
jgi:lipopolysaccharide/colanic/teichoic acid biosynthesis glycosyltransferase